MSAMDNGLNPHVVCIPVGTQAASIELPGVYVRKKSIIKRVAYINQAALAEDGTNFLQVQLLAAPSGSVVAEVSTETGNEGSLAKNVATLAGETEIEVAAGSSLAVNVVKNGTGVPTLGVLQLEMHQL